MVGRIDRKDCWEDLVGLHRVWMFALYGCIWREGIFGLYDALDLFCTSER